MGSCAVGTCGPCASCQDFARRFPATIPRCSEVVYQHGERKGECVLIAGHPSWVPCRVKESAGKVEAAELRETKREQIDFSQPRAAAVSLGRKKRYRQGPHRGNV